ncbi:MAG: acetyl-CoA carboxylase biotin carboxyl carrier protein [Tissierella sp.]|uniref:acetyl-CoA carboxylase biotin carboxyl carrier protein n=1 Tax=Tissierella sp. TaxID=41274 RepID=UPI003F943D0A
MDLKDIKDLILAIDTTSIEKVEIEKDDIKINIYKNIEKGKPVKSSKGEEVYLYENKDGYGDEEEVKTQEKIDSEDSFIVKSPIVGVYYSASSPNSEPFVKVGQKIEKGDTLCIVEAMKIMNEIEAEMDGEIIEIYAQDEDVIQYGQALLKLRRI